MYDFVGLKYVQNTRKELSVKEWSSKTEDQSFPGTPRKKNLAKKRVSNMMVHVKNSCFSYPEVDVREKQAQKLSKHEQKRGAMLNFSPKHPNIAPPYHDIQEPPEKRQRVRGSAAEVMIRCVFQITM